MRQIFDARGFTFAPPSIRAQHKVYPQEERLPQCSQQLQEIRMHKSAIEDELCRHATFARTRRLFPVGLLSHCQEGMFLNKANVPYALVIATREEARL